MQDIYSMHLYILKVKLKTSQMQQPAAYRCKFIFEHIP